MASNSNGISELKENEIPFEIDAFETENVVTKPEDLIEEVQKHCRFIPTSENNRYTFDDSEADNSHENVIETLEQEPEMKCSKFQTDHFP